MHLLPSHCCLASQTASKLALKEVLSAATWSICLRGSITTYLCRKLKTDIERNQTDQNKMVIQWWNTCYSFSYTTATLETFSLAAPQVRKDGAQVFRHHGWSQHRRCSQYSQITEQVKFRSKLVCFEQQVLSPSEKGETSHLAKVFNVTAI